MQQLNVKVSAEEMERFRTLTERLQKAHEGEGVQITTRTTFIRAMNALETYMDKLDRDKERRR